MGRRCKPKLRAPLLTRIMALVRVSACPCSRGVWIGLAIACFVVGIILIVVAGSVGGCDCAQKSCQSGWNFLGCSETSFGQGCDAKSCTYGNNESRIETKGQAMGLLWIEIIAGIGLVSTGIVFSCGVNLFLNLLSKAARE